MKMLMWSLMIMVFFVASCGRKQSVEPQTVIYRLGYLLDVCEGEQVQSIAFCLGPRLASIVESECDCISKPAKVKEIMQTLRRSVTGVVPIRENTGCAYDGWIRIVTDRHKLMTPFWYDCIVKDALSGLDWESCELVKYAYPEQMYPVERKN